MPRPKTNRKILLLIDLIAATIMILGILNKIQDNKETIALIVAALWGFGRFINIMLKNAIIASKNWHLIRRLCKNIKDDIGK